MKSAYKVHWSIPAQALQSLLESCGLSVSDNHTSAADMCTQTPPPAPAPRHSRLAIGLLASSFICSIHVMQPRTPAEVVALAPRDQGSTLLWISTSDNGPMRSRRPFKTADPKSLRSWWCRVRVGVGGLIADLAYRAGLRFPHGDRPLLGSQMRWQLASPSRGRGSRPV